MAQDSHIHDVLIVGAGVTGSTAAALLVRAELDVALLETRHDGDLDEVTDWVNPHAASILGSASISDSTLPGEPIERCTFYSADLVKSIEPAIPQPPPCLVERAELIRTIRGSVAAVSSACLHEGADVLTVQAGEDMVVASLADGRRFFGRLLLIASGHGSRLPEQIGSPAFPDNQPNLHTASYHCPLDGRSEPSTIDFVLGIDREAGIGYRLSRGGFLTVGVCTRAAPSETIACLVALSERFERLGLLPSCWREHARRVVSASSPAGASLLMDSHVTKRTLLIGRAGGFVASHTNEAIYPCMWSARLACEVVCEAIQSRNPQDKLRDFERLWRTELAAHLRSPNADPASILPLVLSNQQMANNMLESFYLGTNL